MLEIYLLIQAKYWFNRTLLINNYKINKENEHVKTYNN